MPTAQLAFACPEPGIFPPTTSLGRTPAPLYLPLSGPGQEAYLSPAGNGIQADPATSIGPDFTFLKKGPQRHSWEAHITQDTNRGR